MASDGSFELPLRNIAGEDCARLRVTPATKLSELRAMAAAEMAWSDYLLTLLHEHQPLTGDRCLGDLHIMAGSEVMVIKHDCWRLVSPGISCYNDAYLCTLKEVREAGYRAIEVDFVAVGDGSMGSLQCPASSRLTWDPPKEKPSLSALLTSIFAGAGAVQSFALPASVLVIRQEDGGYESPSRIEGTMTFENVPTSGQANFIFGSNGYSPLYLALGQKETSSA